MRSRQRHTACQIARFMILFVHSTGSFISNLKLQKLLYYAQGWHLALFDKPLFENRIEAWIHGPVVPDVYHKYSKYRWKPITEKPASVKLDKQTEAFMQELLEVFLPIDATTLEQTTHSEAPWKNARKGLAPDVSCRREITQESIKKYFKTLAA